MGPAQSNDKIFSARNEFLAHVCLTRVISNTRIMPSRLIGEVTSRRLQELRYALPSSLLVSSTTREPSRIAFGYPESCRNQSSETSYTNKKLSQREPGERASGVHVENTAISGANGRIGLCRRGAIRLHTHPA